MALVRVITGYRLILDGRGGNPRRDHLTPADLDDGHSADGQGDPTRGRNHVDITQLNNAPSERLQVSSIEKHCKLKYL